MKKNILISLLLYIIGIALGFIFLFPFADEPQDSYVFGFLGIIISIVALIYGLVLVRIKKKDRVLITSVLTPLYKFYLPIFTLEMLVFNTSLIVFDNYPGNDISVFVAVEIMLFIWVLLLIPCFKLHQISLKGDELIVTNYYNSKKLKITDIEKVHRFFIFFFKVKLRECSFIILPKITESANLFAIPKSIKLLKPSIP